MRILKLLPLFALVALISVGCNKEDLNKQEQQEAKTETKITPRPCQVGQMVDENGALIQPAELTPAMLEAAEMTKTTIEYTIPVVFHVFGTSHTDGWGTKSGKMDAARFEKVLQWINNDYNGVRNPGDTHYFGTVNSGRKEFVDYMPIKFVLAKYMKDGTKLENGQKVYGGKISTNANGGTINGDVAVIIYSASHPVAKAGPGWAAASGVSQISWDNKMYMNVYITNDLYANGEKNNSGVAWYPGTAVKGAERVVYNGTYLPGNNGDKDFTSIISHEFGHFLNLAHTFYEDRKMLCGKYGKDGGKYGDSCADTPEMQCSSDFPAYEGYTKKNCHGELIDYGNFMNYGVYCNFTKNQVTRMKAALQHDLRKPLWQRANLEKVLGADYFVIKNPATIGEKLQEINSKLGK